MSSKKNRKIGKEEFEKAFEKTMEVFRDRVPVGRATTDEQKRQVMDKLLNAWRAAPNQRLGQLLCNAGYATGSDDLFYIEDEDLVARTFKFIKEHCSAPTSPEKD